MICECGHLFKDHEYDKNLYRIAHCYSCFEQNLNCCHILAGDNLKFLEQKYEESISD